LPPLLQGVTAMIARRSRPGPTDSSLGAPAANQPDAARTATPAGRARPPGPRRTAARADPPPARSFTPYQRPEGSGGSDPVMTDEGRYGQSRSALTRVRSSTGSTAARDARRRASCPGGSPAASAGGCPLTRRPTLAQRWSSSSSRCGSVTLAASPSRVDALISRVMGAMRALGHEPDQPSTSWLTRYKAVE